MIQKLAILFFIIAVSVGFIWWDQVRTPESYVSKSITIKKQMQKIPDFTFTTIDGKQHEISQFKDKKVLLNFWATWCPPCI